MRSVSPSRTFRIPLCSNVFMPSDEAALHGCDGFPADDHLLDAVAGYQELVDAHHPPVAGVIAFGTAFRPADFPLVRKLHSQCLEGLLSVLVCHLVPFLAADGNGFAAMGAEAADEALGQDAQE